MGNSPLNKYHATKVNLSKGGNNVVFKATEKSTGKNWAMKRYDKKGEYRRDFVMQEVKAMRLCQHGNIVVLKEHFDTSHETIMIIEFCEVGELSDRIKLKGDQLTEYEGAGWLRQILSALAHLSDRRICHRDVKPESFVFSNTETLKLTEFGVACTVNHGEVLRHPVGTDVYKAPELYFDDQREQVGYSFPVDMWAAGLTFHAIMTGTINGPFFARSRVRFSPKC